MDELDLGLKESIADVRELLLHFRTRTQSDDIETAVHAHTVAVAYCHGVLGEVTVDSLAQDA